MFGKSLEVQWLGLRALTARTHFFPFRELRSHKLLGGAKKIKSNGMFQLLIITCLPLFLSPYKLTFTLSLEFLPNFLQILRAT